MQKAERAHRLAAFTLAGVMAFELAHALDDSVEVARATDTTELPYDQAENIRALLSAIKDSLDTADVY